MVNHMASPNRAAAHAIRRTLLIFLCMRLLLAADSAFAQGETTSAIAGQVIDASGAPVPGAVVSVKNNDTGLKRIATTDDSGRFNFPQLKPGGYSVRVAAEGFKPQQNESVSSALGQTQDITFSLE